jgi:hypothetical protein
VLKKTDLPEELYEEKFRQDEKILRAFLTANSKRNLKGKGKIPWWLAKKDQKSIYKYIDTRVKLH